MMLEYRSSCWILEGGFLLGYMHKWAQNGPSALLSNWSSRPSRKSETSHLQRVALYLASTHWAFKTRHYLVLRHNVDCASWVAGQYGSLYESASTSLLLAKGESLDSQRSLYKPSRADYKPFQFTFRLAFQIQSAFELGWGISQEYDNMRSTSSLPWSMLQVFALSVQVLDIQGIPQISFHVPGFQYISKIWQYRPEIVLLVRGYLELFWNVLSVVYPWTIPCPNLPVPSQEDAASDVKSVKCRMNYAHKRREKPTVHQVY